VTAWRFCPQDGTPLVEREAGGKVRPVCPKEGCGFVAWGNPTPVVAAILEHEGAVLLVRNKGWPEKLYGLLTGFLEAGETAEAGMLREVKEELDLDGEIVSLVGVYVFELRNELIIAYHVKGRGTPKASSELEGFKRIDPDKLRPWEFGTGQAVKDWLARRKGG
jgi:NAD+ diphosphatase